MPRTKYDFGITQGYSFRVQVVYRNPDNSPVNLNGFSAFVRFLRPGMAVPAFYGDTSNGKVNIKGSLGIVEFVLTPTETANLASGSYLYDVKIVAPVINEQTQLVSGRVTLNVI